MSLLDRLFSSVPADQISPRGIQWMLGQSSQVQTELFQFLEPGKQIPFESQMFVSNATAEFDDPKLGIIYGQGTGHAIVRVSVLRDVARSSAGSMRDFRSLVDAFRKQGYTTKKIGYISVI